MSSLAGHEIGRYHLIEPLGQGGMATVYRAYDTRLERPVAIKVIRMTAFSPEILDQMLLRFEREAKALAKLSHHNIVKIYDFGEYQSSPYLVMEYLPGGTLKSHNVQCMPWPEAVRLLIPVGQAIAYAHKHNILHRDIKPSNILINEEGEPMLTDFGIAKILDAADGQTLTGTGVGVGTPEYMAPEQWMGQTSVQTDIYALGVVFYELLTGHKPFTAETPAAILIKSINDPLPRPQLYVPDLPENVEQVLYKALAKKPEDRYSTMGEFVSALQKLEALSAPKPEAVIPEYSQDGKAVASLSQPVVSRVEGIKEPVVEQVTQVASPAEGRVSAQPLTPQKLEDFQRIEPEKPTLVIAPKTGKKNQIGLFIGLPLILIIAIGSIWAFPRMKSESNSTTPTGLAAESSSIPLESSVATPQPTSTLEPTRAISPTPVETDPVKLAWRDSAHNDGQAEAFIHWNSSDPAEVPASCAKCHSEGGALDFLGFDGTASGSVENAAPVGTTITCQVCHNDAVKNKTSVMMPSGIEITGLGAEVICIECHQGRLAKPMIDSTLDKFGVSSDLDKVSPTIDNSGQTQTLGFLNIHYYAAAASLYGGIAQGGYQYDNKLYDPLNSHADGYQTCQGCHDPHSLQIKFENCAECHGAIESLDDVKNIRMVSSLIDFDGDGDISEGLYYEIQGLQAILLDSIKKYGKTVAGAGITYDSATYPYFFQDDNSDGSPDQKDGGAVAYQNWTGRLLKAAYNYQFSLKDPGSYAHNGNYIIELLYDSVEDLNNLVPQPIDMSKLARQEGGHFDGAKEAFRHWDSEGEVPFACARCHSAFGLPEYIENNGSITISSGGSLTVAGINAQPLPNSLMCSTCHDEAQFPALITVSAVQFPSGAFLSFGGSDTSGNLLPHKDNLCLECHQGRESTTSLNTALANKQLDAVDETIRFRNVHYFPAATTLFGGKAMGAFQYDGKSYVESHPHQEFGFSCTTCHDAHSLDIKTEFCTSCHPNGSDGLDKIRMDNVDYDGDGNLSEGIKGDIAALAEALYTRIQSYALKQSGSGILYDPSIYPFFFMDGDNDGEPDKDDLGTPIGYNQFSPRLLKAAYNYQYFHKDPGNFAHNSTYIIQILYDSIRDLGGNVNSYTRP